MKGIIEWSKEHAATILTYIGATGVVATSVLAVKATPEAMKIIEEERIKRAESTTTTVFVDNEKNEKRVGNLLRSVGGNAKLNEASNVIDLPYEFIEYAIYNYNHYAIPQETLLRVLAYYELTMDDISDRLVSDMVEDDEDIDLDELIGGLDD